MNKEEKNIVDILVEDMSKDRNKLIKNRFCLTITIVSLSY